MSADRVVVSDTLRLALGIARGVIALVLAALELYPRLHPLTGPSVAYLLYAVFALIVLQWERRDHGSGDLLRLIVDIITLLVCAVNPPDRAGWVVGVFYLFVLTNASLLHQLREIAMTVAVVVAFTALTANDQAVSLGPAVVFPGALAIIAGWQRRNLEARLQIANRQSVMFRTEAENARELERQRIAADFHDGPLQSFISFQMRLEVIKKLLARDQQLAITDLTQLQDICRKQITDMRTFVRSMRVTSDGSTPATSVRQIADDFQKNSGIQLTWNVADSLSGLEPEISHEVLQIVREALHNAQKHSKASKVSLASEKADGALTLVVEDDGSGFPFGGTYNLEELELMGMGPESIKRRVRTLNGELIVESTPGRGAVLRVRVPL
ncbi:MAG TPA: sensor histidine kinase [Bryobacteraceae bacterium]|nr:sensor histidine kinase [Bryobacteraceae bacterium]